MKIIEHNSGTKKAVEIISDDVLISSEHDALDLMADIEYQYESNKSRQVLFLNDLSTALQQLC